MEVLAPLDIYPPRPGKPDWMQKIASWKRGPSDVPMWKDRTLTSWVQQYYQAVSAIDEGVGRVLAALDESGQAKNTLVVFTSDQGFAWGQHGFRHKLAAYDANIRAPLIVRQAAKIPAGTVCKTPVGGIDLIPTFFNLANIPVPWKMHGRDLSPLLENPDAPWKYPVLLTNTGAKYGSDTHTIPTDETLYQNSVPWYVMLRQGQYKYIRSLVAGAIEELYDLDSDPEELTNLAQSKASILGRMRMGTLAALRRADAGFVDHLPPIGK
jgi:arylsulfatase A-like enzyme